MSKRFFLLYHANFGHGALFRWITHFVYLPRSSMDFVPIFCTTVDCSNYHALLSCSRFCCSRVSHPLSLWLTYHRYNEGCRAVLGTPTLHTSKGPCLWQPDNLLLQVVAGFSQSHDLFLSLRMNDTYLLKDVLVAITGSEGGGLNLCESITLGSLVVYCPPPPPPSWAASALQV